MVTELIKLLEAGQPVDVISERTGLSEMDIEAVQDSPLVRLRLSASRFEFDVRDND